MEKLRKRVPDTGLIKPYRPRPADFRETYIRMGWDGIDEHYRTNWRVIRRWILEQIAEDDAAGVPDVKKARASWVREIGYASRHCHLAQRAAEGAGRQ